MADIGCIVVTYNRKEYLEKNIEALLNQTYSDFDIIIVDNASNDGTRELIDNYIKLENVFYYNTGENLGGAGGFNYGLKKSIEKGNKYCWIMDDDTIPAKDALESLIKKADTLKDEFSFLCSVVKWIDGTSCKMNIPYICKDWFDCMSEQKKGLIKVKACSFVSCFVNSKIIKKVGFPISDFFIYGDDVEYTLRLSTMKQGYLDVESFVLHDTKENVSDDIFKVSPERIERYIYRYRNLYYNICHYDLFTLKEYYISVIKKIIKILLLCKDNKMKRVGVIIKGVRAGKRFKPSIDKVANNFDDKGVNDGQN